jgi:hypothetical protein
LLIGQPHGIHAGEGVGEPCAGEPHAPFDGRGLETERYGVTALAPDPTTLGAALLSVYGAYIAASILI